MLLLLTGCLVNHDLYDELAADFDTGEPGDSGHTGHELGTGWAWAAASGGDQRIKVRTADGPVHEERVTAGSAAVFYDPVREELWWLTDSGDFSVKGYGASDKDIGLFIPDIGQVRAVAAADGRAWALTETALWRYVEQGAVFEEVDIFDGRALVLDEAGGVSFFDAGSQTLTTLDADSTLPGTSVSAPSSAVDMFWADAVVWACGSGGQIWKLDGSAVAETGLSGVQGCGYDGDHDQVLVGGAGRIDAFGLESEDSWNVIDAAESTTSITFFKVP
ncbi:MAG: hypothetical protein GY884_30405 [Proteobacteria bacterium]|nr:hypothetical protein [Pseudomonadota bacterium]